jgi:hypothetical protein
MCVAYSAPEVHELVAHSCIHAADLAWIESTLYATTVRTVRFVSFLINRLRPEIENIAINYMTHLILDLSYDF